MTSVRLIQVSLNYPPEVGTPYNYLCGEAMPEWAPLCLRYILG